MHEQIPQFTLLSYSVNFLQLFQTVSPPRNNARRVLIVCRNPTRRDIWAVRQWTLHTPCQNLVNTVDLSKGSFSPLSFYMVPLSSQPDISPTFNDSPTNLPHIDLYLFLDFNFSSCGDHHFNIANLESLETDRPPNKQMVLCSCRS